MSKRRRSKFSQDEKMAYLSFVQGIISRMATYSCALKGSCCAVGIAMLALFQDAGLSGARGFAGTAIVLFLFVAFACFDAKYLQLERRYRVLYKTIDENEDGDYPTTMEAPAISEDEGTLFSKAFFSWAVFGFYSIVAVAFVLVSVVLFLV